MKFGLTDQIIEGIQQVLESNPEIDKAIVFGSRAKGNYKDGSDIDIAIKGENIKFDDILTLNAQLDKLNIPYDIDLINYSDIKEPDLIEHIDRAGVEFYSRWKRYKLGSLVDVINGYAFKSSDFSGTLIPGSLPVIKIKNVANGDVNLNDCQYHLFEKHLAKYLVKRNDILIALTGNHPEIETQVVGATSRYKHEESALLNQRVAKIQPREKIDQDFIYYFLNSNDTHDYLASHSSGSANQANISKTDIENIQISLPPISEQENIAAVLLSLDNKIDLLQRQNKTLESMAEALFRQWFIEDSHQDWEEKSLTQIANYLNGIALQNYPDQGKGYLPVIKIREMKLGNTENADRCDINIPSEYLVNNGDILFSWSGSLEVVIWGGGRGALNQHLFKVTSSDYPKWFYYFATKCHLDDFRAIAESKSTTMGHIQRSHLQKATIKVPPTDLLKSLESTISPIIEKKITNNSQIASLTSARDTLLPKLLSGEVRIKMP